MSGRALAVAGILLGVAGLVLWRSARQSGDYAQLVYKAENVVYDALGERRSMSLDGVERLKQHEAFAPTPYRDQAGHLTIGYGHKLKSGEAFTAVSEPQALELLARDLADAEDAVNSLVKVPLTQSQFDALVSFTYNVGGTALRDSTLLRKLNDGDYAAVPAELGRWRYVTVAGSKVESQGLINRRRDEAAQFQA